MKLTFRKLADLRSIAGAYADTLPMEYPGCRRDRINEALTVATKKAHGEYDDHPDRDNLFREQPRQLRAIANRTDRIDAAVALRALATFIEHGEMSTTLPPTLAAQDGIGEFVAAHIRNTCSDCLHAYVVAPSEGVLQLVDETGAEVAVAHHHRTGPAPGWYVAATTSTTEKGPHSRTSAIRLLRHWQMP
ncbi:hypothetical protein [Nocardiopsis sp. FR26]|uniref:hypothetical protein n=1 Tax=Nocardiopsis sp. FR26 TaxID=2605987 RepID=UPI001356E3C5|nr:hypothetical protein [Nocardiopsis sp. FR26]